MTRPKNLDDLGVGYVWELGQPRYYFWNPKHNYEHIKFITNDAFTPSWVCVNDWRKNSIELKAHQIYPAISDQFIDYLRNIIRSFA
jgi:hypothetical protein